MKRFWLVGIFLLISSVCFASIVDIGGFGYTVKTNTHNSSTGKETDKVVWTPASGAKITLLGVKFSSDVNNSFLVETSATAVIPTTGYIASAICVIGDGTPIWEGAIDENLTYTTDIISKHSILMWGYEH